MVDFFKNTFVPMETELLCIQLFPLTRGVYSWKLSLSQPKD